MIQLRKQQILDLIDQIAVGLFFEIFLEIDQTEESNSDCAVGFAAQHACRLEKRFEDFP